MKFKHKFYLGLLVGWLLACAVIYFHGARIWECKSTGWQLGRTTEYSIITGKCAMATGRIDGDGNPVMVIQNNDRGVGGEYDSADDDSE